MNKNVNAHPPDIPANPSAQYFHLPAKEVVKSADSNHTGTKDFGPSGAEEETFGIIRARKVDKWTT